VPNSSQDNPGSLVERQLDQSLTDRAGVGKPLSRRARQTQRSVEAYLSAGVLPRYMERLREIDSQIRKELRRLERAYRIVKEACGENADLFARQWRARAHAWPFEHVNELIREHNEWYPMEAGLPLDPRTCDYVRIRGRPYQRDEIGAEWVLERFPPEPESTN
jgi:hypothetical protein